MHDFIRTNKISGVHWLKNPIEKMKIRVKLKPQDGIMSLPKFEDYANEPNGLNAETFENIDEYTFKWQEKSFSLWEMQRYSDAHNCITDTELIYNDTLNNMDYEPSKVFTYIHDDYHLPLPLNHVKKKNHCNNMLDFNSCFERLNLTKKVERAFVGETSSLEHIFKSQENLLLEDEQWIAMHVAYDCSDYNEDSQLVFKQEAILLSLYYNVTHNYLLISPDWNDLDLNPYSMQTEAGVPLGQHYALSVNFEEGEEGEELEALLHKLHKKWEKKHRHLVNFCTPPLGRKWFQLTLEILSAEDFEMDHLSIDFTLKMPGEIQCKEALHGRTHTSAALRYDDTEEWAFGHLAEFSLEMDANIEPPPLQLFFEVISTDWWGRDRTEGYSYLALSLKPGSKKRTLSCSRPEESDKVEADSRRFFVGGCHLIKDLDVLAKPQFQDAKFIFSATGSITIRTHVVSACALPPALPPSPALPPAPGGSGAALLRGAEAALRHYRKARARLAAATRDLGEVGDSVHDGSGDR